MMCIIVNDGDTVYGSFVLETAVCTVESVQTSDDGICADSHGTGKGDGGHGISGIVSSGNGKPDFTDGLFVVHGGKRRTGFVIICQIICIIFTGIIKTVGDDLLWKSVGQFLMVCNFSIDNGCSVCQCIAGKFTERTTDVVDILEKSRCSASTFKMMLYFGRKFRKLLVYSQASETKIPE